MEEEVRIKASIEQYIHKRLNCSIGKLFQDEIFNNLKKNFAVWIKIAVDSEEVNACIFNIIDMEIEKLEPIPTWGTPATRRIRTSAARTAGSGGPEAAGRRGRVRRHGCGDRRVVTQQKASGGFLRPSRLL